MAKLFTAFLIVIGVGLVVSAQTRTDLARSEPRLRKDRPGVYISFERVGKVKVSEIGEGNERLWLRVHNNTRRPISLDMSGAEEDYGDAELYYSIWAGDQVIIERQCHACAHSPIDSGQSLVFSIPRHYLVKGHWLQVNFDFGWNDSNGTREVEYSVTFKWNQIPTKATVEGTAR